VPEGDTVWLAARRLHAALAGHVLTASDFRVPALATVDLGGVEVAAVVSRGKHLLLRLGGARTLHTHFRMDGAWHLYRPGAPWRGGPAWQVRVVLRTPSWVAVGYRLPVVELLATADEPSVVGHLGPDLLDPDPDLEAAVARLRAAPQREIGDALLDQRNLAGIGNLYKAETLFLAGVEPSTEVADVPDLPGLVRRARELLLANRDRPEQITTGVTRRGQQHWVFERAGRPCRRCGTTVRSDRQGRAPYDRITYWCPTCQPTAAARLLR
jgi:endonuclease-8